MILLSRETTPPLLIKPLTDEEENVIVEKAFNDLMKFCTYLPDDTYAGIRQAFEFARDKHKGMYRKSGEPYILHPITVAKIVATDMNLDAESIKAALLHDVHEDTATPLEDIEHYFGLQIRFLVEGLSKIKGFVDDRSFVEKQAENIRKTLVTLGSDIRIILIKIADRLHNMLTMKSMPYDKQIRIASETLALYVPIAHRLGMYKIKSQLEDLCMKCTQPHVYKAIHTMLNREKKREREAFIQKIVAPIKKILEAEGHKNLDIYGRPKHIFSIYQKMQARGQTTIDDIYDLFAIRIIFDVEGEFEDLEAYKKEERKIIWNVFALVSTIYQTVPGRHKDMVNHRKENEYQALHDTFTGPDGRRFEVQIRSKRMDNIAERGIVAHWNYKNKKSENKILMPAGLDNWLAKVRDFLAQMHTDEHNALNWVREFTHELYKDEIIVSTPAGEIKYLPAGATVLDFAYEVHTELGNTCVGAKINKRDKLYNIDHELSSGDTISIITSKRQKPNLDWLNFARTSRARSKIRSTINTQKRDLAQAGQEILTRKLKSLKINENDHVLQQIAFYFKLETIQDLYVSIAKEHINIEDLRQLSFLGDKMIATPEEKKAAQALTSDVITEIENKINNKFNSNNTQYSGGVTVFEGFADKVDYSIATCCHPVPGDSIIGFVSISNGIRLHRESCTNVPNLISKYPYRVVKVRWAKQSKEILFHVGLRIVGQDDIGVVLRLGNIISGEMQLNMRSLKLDAGEGLGLFEGYIEVYVKNNRQLNELIKRLKDEPGIYSVAREGDLIDTSTS